MIILGSFVGQNEGITLSCNISNIFVYVYFCSESIAFKVNQINGISFRTFIDKKH